MYTYTIYLRVYVHDIPACVCTRYTCVCTWANLPRGGLYTCTHAYACMWARGAGVACILAHTHVIYTHVHAGRAAGLCGRPQGGSPRLNHAFFLKYLLNSYRKYKEKHIMSRGLQGSVLHSYQHHMHTCALMSSLQGGVSRISLGECFQCP